MDDNLKLKIDELKDYLVEGYTLFLSKEFRDKQLNRCIDKIKKILHEVTIDPLKRKYYFYQLFGILVSYSIFMLLSISTLIPRYGITIRVFFPHYRTLHWLALSIFIAVILYKLIRYYYHEILMRDKIVANGEKGTADWANESIHELKDDESNLFETEGLVTVPIYFRTLEELEEEEKFLEDTIQKINEQLKEEKEGINE
ncbi:MAG: hypothetical protein Q4Q00_00575 [Turicibacter sp.]|nr:hypothetical protein [Turicibacter sp.]